MWRRQLATPSRLITLDASADIEVLTGLVIQLIVTGFIAVCYDNHNRSWERRSWTSFGEC